MAEFEKWVDFAPAYDKRHSDPSKNYGIGSVSVQFCLKGPDGGVTFAFLTDWYLPHNMESGRSIRREPLYAWRAGVHCKTPMYDSQTPHEDCALTGGTCYSDGSALLGQEWCDVLIREGSVRIWELMEQRYADHFGGEEPHADHFPDTAKMVKEPSEEKPCGVCGGKGYGIQLMDGHLPDECVWCGGTGVEPDLDDAAGADA